MFKRLLFVLALVAIVAFSANAEVSKADLGAVQYPTLGNDSNMFIERPNTPERELPMPGVELVQSGIDYGDGSVSTPVAYQEARHIAIAPHTIVEDNSEAVWCVWETGSNDDNECYSKYYHSFYGFWDGPYQVSETVNDAGRPAMCVTDNGMLHAVYHGDHDATGAYEIAYTNHSGVAFGEWSDPVIISTNDDEGLFPTIAADGNDVWVSYERFWQAPNQELDLQHGVWDEDSGTMTWWASGDIKMITQSEAGWFFGSMNICPAGMVHIAYGNSDDNLAYRIFDPAMDDFTGDEEEVDAGPEGGECFSPSLVVDSQGEVHIVYPYSYYGGEAGNLGTVNYVHGNYGDWSEPEFLHFWEGNVDTFSTYPVIGIDGNDNLWVTYTNLHGVDEQGSGYYQLVLNSKEAGSEDWYMEYITKPEGEGVPELPGQFVYNEVPNYPSITHAVPSSGPALIYAEYNEDTVTSSVYTAIPDIANFPNPGTGVAGENIDTVPSAVALHQNYPNPFNPTTNISFELSKKSHVELNIYNAKGELVNTLVNGEKDASYHTVTWNGTDVDGNKVSSGVYVYTLKTDDLTESKSMILLK
jgi:hypothetical protein